MNPSKQWSLRNQSSLWPSQPSSFSPHFSLDRADGDRSGSRSRLVVEPSRLYDDRRLSNSLTGSAGGASDAPTCFTPADSTTLAGIGAAAVGAPSTAERLGLRTAGTSAEAGRTPVEFAGGAASEAGRTGWPRT